MSGSRMLWRRQLWIWLPPAVALLAATVYLVYLERGVRARGANLESRLEVAERQHEEAQAALAKLEKLDGAAQATREQIQHLMEEKFATESGRLTSLIREIKQLAEHAGLDPRDIGYPQEELDELGLVRRSFIFSVQGSYANLRAFLYLLELSPSYVTVDQIELRELSGAKGLGVSLRLSTFFSVPPGGSPGAGLPATGGRS
jgi:type IV pilus assembly protein PilO